MLISSLSCYQNSFNEFMNPPNFYIIDVNLLINHSVGELLLYRLILCYVLFSPHLILATLLKVDYENYYQYAHSHSHTIKSAEHLRFP